MSERTCPSCRLPLPDDAAFCAQCGAATATHIFGDTLTGTRVSNGAVAQSYELEPERLKRVLGSHFELGRLIGRGGYAEVFAVKDLRLKRELAIKVLRPDLVVTPSLLTRFRREAEAVAALAHPNIVPVYDVGEVDGICYIVMPLIQGESLKALLQRQHRLPVEEVRRIVVEAANALSAAHKAGVIHRDIKPENIMLEGPERRVLVMDFGISKAMDSGDTQLTGTGVIVGTPQYMSPEQASGDPNIDQRTDQYSLAVVAYQMMSGRAPFDGETARAIMVKQLTEEPTPLPQLVPDLPGPVSAALYRALQKDPTKRFDSIGEFAQLLAAGQVAEVPVWAPGGRPAATPQGAARWVPWAIAAAAVAVVGWVGIERLTAPPAISAAAPPPVPTSTTPPPPPEPTAPAGTPPSVTPSTRPAPPASRATRETTVVQVPPPRPDTTVPAPVAEVDCAAAFRSQDWPVAYRRCSLEARTNPMAARYAAEMASEGRGTTRSEQAATEWYEIAAPNDPPALLVLARRYEQGIGGDKDPSKATDYYVQAAAAGVHEAVLEAARRLEQGIGRPKNESEAARWFERAAASGHQPSQLRIATMYAQGRVVPRSDSAARKWFEQAALGGNAAAQFELAKLLFRGGKGVPRSDQDGMTWLERAAAAGHPEAAKELEKRRTN